MSIFDDIWESIKNFTKKLTTEYEKSSRWLEYLLGPTKSHCEVCAKRNHKIYSPDDKPPLPEHERCLCYLEWLRKMAIGSATKLGEWGADFYLYSNGKLSDYYITKEQARALGWIAAKGNLDKVAAGKMIGGDIFLNKEGKLPDALGRLWYECDIDYEGGYRNNYRLVYSNDGLIFRTDSHYEKFIAVE